MFKQERKMIDNPHDNLRKVLSTDSRDWSTNRNDAWIYGIVCGWENDCPLDGESEDDAVDEICLKHGFDKEKLKTLRKKYLNMKVGMEQILMAEVKKKFKFGNDETCYRHSFTSFDRDKLKDKIEKYYSLTLEKEEDNDFPWFTDGGFKYFAENDTCIFEITAIWYDIV